jgi:hypothetical protein
MWWRLALLICIFSIVHAEGEEPTATDVTNATGSANNATSAASSGCDILLQKNLSPKFFTIFNAEKGETYSIGETVQIMARFPDGVCNLPDPADLGPNCLPKLNLAIMVKSEQISVQNITLQAARGLSKLAESYGVDYTTQDGFYDETLGINSIPWLFYLEVGPGMSTRSGFKGNLDVNWFQIPKECNHSTITFNTSKIEFESGKALHPAVTIDTFPPVIKSIYTTEKDGNYTTGKFIDIIVEFSGDIKFSQQPDVFSQVP